MINFNFLWCPDNVWVLVYIAEMFESFYYNLVHQWFVWNIKSQGGETVLSYPNQGSLKSSSSLLWIDRILGHLALA